MYAVRGAGVKTKAYGCVQGEEALNAGEYVRISTIYFPFLKIFSIKNAK